MSGVTDGLLRSVMSGPFSTERTPSWRRNFPLADEDPRLDPSTPGNPPMPFDGKRMIFGGFQQVVEVKA